MIDDSGNMRPNESREYRRLRSEQEAATRANSLGRLGRIFIAVAALSFLVAGFVYSYKAFQDTEELLVDGTEECGDCPYYVNVQLQADLERMTNKIIAKSSKKDPISWSLYSSDPVEHDGCPIRLMQDDFANGTLRIQSGGYFYLGEDVSFHPNPLNDYKPYASQTQYAGVAYSLGFFAAITVEAPDVVIDLRGFQLRQSTAHKLAQRFFSLIELGEAPFLGGQGPKDFGPEVTTVDGVTIMNGVLGINSHHGIHGNTGDRVYIKNVILEKYEVAAIALNGFREVAIVNTQTLGTDTAIPVVGRWSNARFLKDFASLALNLSGGANPTEEGNLSTAMDVLADLEAEVFSDIVDNELAAINATAHPIAADLFGSPSGFFDGGTTYGIVFHPVGHATNGFFSDPDREHLWETRDILIKDVVVGPTVALGMEVIALAHVASGVIQRGPVGEIIQVERAMDSNGDYVVDPLVEAQLALADLVRLLTVPQQAMFNMLNIHPDILTWRAGNVSMTTLVNSSSFEYLRNGDTMRHVGKGVISLRADGVQRFCMQNVELQGTLNLADRAKLTPLPGETSVFYFDGSDGGHENQAPQRGFMGSDARGIAFAGSNQVFVKGAKIENVSTRFGFAYGVEVFNYADTVNLEGVDIRNVTSLLFDPPGSETNIAMGPKVGRAVGVVTSDNTRSYCEQQITVEEVETDYVSLAATHVHGCSL